MWERIRADLNDPPVSPTAALVIVAFAGLIAWLAYSAPNLSVIRTVWGYGVACVVAAILVAIGWAPIINREVRPKIIEISRWFDDIIWQVGGLFAQTILKGIQYLVSVPDIILVRIVSLAGGVTVNEIEYRYAVMIAGLGLLIEAALMAPAPYNAVALTFAFSLVLSIVRRWQWFEADRQIFLSNQDESSFRILKPNGRNQDLRDEALTALATIFFLVPIALLQLQTAYGWFDATPDTDLIEWAGFVGAELAKAVPFVDWAEVYAVTSDSPIKAVDMHALHAVFAVRVLFDLLLIASLVQGAQIMGRLARQRKLLRDGKIDLVDPLLENEEFLRAFHEGWFWFESNPFVDFAFRRFLTRGQGWWNNNHYKVERLIAIIRNKTHWDRRIRIAAARLAGKHQDPHKFLDDLVVTLKDTKDDSSVRMAVAHALAEIKNSAALDALIAVLRNKDDRSRIRAVAGRALGQIGDPAAVKPLIAVLLDNKDRHQVRQSAALALGDIQDPGAVEPLISVLLSNEVGESVYGYEARALRRAAAEALGKIRDPRAVNPLLEILMDKNEDDWLRKIVALALGHIGDERAVEPLIAILQNKRRKLADLRRAAARALGGIGGERAVAALNEAASKDRDLLVRLEAQLALKDIERREQAEPNAATPTQEASNRDSELEKRELRYERWLHRRASREHDFHRDAKMWGRKIWSRAWPWISG